MDFTRFPALLITVVSKLLPETRMTFETLDVRTGAVTNVCNFVAPDHTGWRPRLDLFTLETPVVAYVRGPGDGERAARLSDFLTRRELPPAGEPLPEVDQSGEAGWQVRVNLPIGGHIAGLTVNRPGPSLSETDQHVLQLLAPHIGRAYANAGMLDSLRRELAAQPAAPATPPSPPPRRRRSISA